MRRQLLYAVMLSTLAACSAKSPRLGVTRNSLVDCSDDFDDSPVQISDDNEFYNTDGSLKGDALSKYHDGRCACPASWWADDPIAALNNGEVANTVYACSELTDGSDGNPALVGISSYEIDLDGYAHFLGLYITEKDHAAERPETSDYAWQLSGVSEDPTSPTRRVSQYFDDLATVSLRPDNQCSGMPLPGFASVVEHEPDGDVSTNVAYGIDYDDGGLATDIDITGGDFGEEVHYAYDAPLPDDVTALLAYPLIYGTLPGSPEFEDPYPADAIQAEETP